MLILPGKSDDIMDVEPLLDLKGTWKAYLARAVTQPMEEWEGHERPGRPPGAESFIDQVSKRVGRDLRPKKPGPKIQAH